MGGEYLPDLEESEVEIARIEIESSTFDVTSVYARRGERAGSIEYRIIDEYGGETLAEPNTMSSEQPLSLREMVAFFLGGWSLVEVLESNFEGDLAGMLRFFRGVSDSYPEFDRYLREVVREAVRSAGKGGSHRNLG